MNILVLNGSPRPNGSTAKFLYKNSDVTIDITSRRCYISITDDTATVTTDSI